MFITIWTNPDNGISHLKRATVQAAEEAARAAMQRQEQEAVDFSCRNGVLVTVCPPAIRPRDLEVYAM